MKVEPLLSQRLAPGKIQEAYEGMLNSPEEFTGMLFDWSGDV